MFQYGRAQGLAQETKAVVKILFAGMFDELEMDLTKSAQERQNKMVSYRSLLPLEFLFPQLEPPSLTNAHKISG